MNPYWLLVPVSAMCVFGAWATYTKWAKDSYWYTPSMIALSALCGLCFAVAVKRFGDAAAKVYVFSLSYDTVMMVAYYLLPLVAFGTRVTAGVMLGAAMVAAGLLIVHASAAD
jgi:hypothetical protein